MRAYKTEIFLPLCPRVPGCCHSVPQPPSVTIVLAFVFLLMAGCAALPRVPARGSLAGETMDTTVDSAAARCLLDVQIDADAHQAAARCGLDGILARYDSMPLTRGTLAALADEISVDVAVIYLVRRVLANSRNAHWQQALVGEVEAIRRSGVFQGPLAYGDHLIVFVPGWLYRFQPGTGADFSRELRLLHRFGLRAWRLDVNENGTIEANARRIAAGIQDLARSETSLILVSTSKAGPEVAYALGALLTPKETRVVKAWLSIGGILQGTAIADDARRWPRSWLAALYFWWHGFSTDSIESMTTVRSRARLEEVRIPPHILLVHYMAAPLSGQISEGARDRYLRMRRLGPNDGLTLLADELLPDGIVVVEPGDDHYYRDLLRDYKTLAFARLIIGVLEARK